MFTMIQWYCYIDMVEIIWQGFDLYISEMSFQLSIFHESRYMGCHSNEIRKSYSFYSRFEKFQNRIIKSDQPEFRQWFYFLFKLEGTWKHMCNTNIPNRFVFYYPKGIENSCGQIWAYKGISDICIHDLFNAVQLECNTFTCNFVYFMIFHPSISFRGRMRESDSNTWCTLCTLNVFISYYRSFILYWF